MSLAWAVLGGWMLIWLVRTPVVWLLIGFGYSTRNYRGLTVVSAAGVLFAVSTILAAVMLARMQASGGPWLLVVVGFGALGMFDDHCGTREAGGFRGHLRELLRGKVTTGLVKLVGGVGVAAWAAYCVYLVTQPVHWAIVVLDAGVIAGMSNALNLLDTRPLRVLKAWTAMALPLAVFAALTAGGAGPVWGAEFLLCWLLGSIPPYATMEARREVMLGDTGSNCLGAILGLAIVVTTPLWVRGSVLLLILLLHAWTEKHSINEWIDAHPWVRRLDRLGWGEGE